METKFRSIPITILDFLGVLIPGFLWLILLVKSYDAAIYPATRTSNALQALEKVSKLASVGNWIGPLVVIFASIIIGYSVKPLTLRVAGLLAKPMFALMSETQGTPWRRMRFPYHAYFKNTSYYRQTCKVLEKITKVNPEDLPRVGTFAGAKRYLHAAAPALWEESERMEAEVRLLGSLYLAATYSAFLHAVLAVTGYRWGLAWSVLSLIFALVLALGFSIVRFREVAYTYVNVVIADGLLMAEGQEKQGVDAKEAEEEDG